MMKERLPIRSEWPRRGSNPHESYLSRDFKSRASANSATRPFSKSSKTGSLNSDETSCGRKPDEEAAFEDASIRFPTALRLLRDQWIWEDCSPRGSRLLRLDFPNSSTGQADKWPIVHLSLLSTSKKNAHIFVGV